MIENELETVAPTRFWQQQRGTDEPTQYGTDSSTRLTTSWQQNQQNQQQQQQQQQETTENPSTLVPTNWMTVDNTWWSF
jgi:hypothetical protein